jgi:2,3,4,5-tetrahydropyridine-2-carboxylate N-succinyltransferase
MNIEKIKSVIDRVFDNNEDVNPNTSGEIRVSIETALDCLDKGELRVAEPLGNSKWQVNQWLKKAVLLSFKINDMDVISGGPQSPNSGPTNWWDKIPSKFSGWNKKEFKEAGFRAVPGSVVRHSAYIAPSVVLMPSFVNIGAYVDTGTMIDTWATVGSCAQIGKNVHIFALPYYFPGNLSGKDSELVLIMYKVESSSSSGFESLFLTIILLPSYENSTLYIINTNSLSFPDKLPGK